MYDAAAVWRRLPVDDVDYIDARDLLALSDDDLRNLIDRMAVSRYSGWRNHEGRWVAKMHGGLSDRRILDYGCGVGLEAVSLANAGNRVVLSDINPESLELASRVMRLYGHEPTTGSYDVFYANGVLHHVPDPEPVLQEAADQGATEFRLMLYTDRAHEMYGEGLARAMDFEATFTTWYDPDRLQGICPAGWRVAEWTYLTPTEVYAAARVLREDLCA